MKEEERLGLEQERLKADVTRLQARVDALEYVVVALAEELGVDEKRIETWIRCSQSPHVTSMDEVRAGGSNLLKAVRLRRDRLGEAHGERG